MALTLELKDGSIIVPRSVFDVLDAIEEGLGIEARQYLEDYLEDEEEIYESDDHYRTVLENIDYIITGMGKLLLAKRLNRKALLDSLEQVEALVRREMRGFT